MSQPPTSGWPTGEPQEPQGGWPQRPQQPWDAPEQPAAPQQPPVGQPPSPPPPQGPWQPQGQSGWPPGEPQWQPPAQPGAANPTGAYAGGQWDQLGGATSASHRRKHGGRGRLIAAVVAVVALAGGGVATYVAVSDSNSHHGASSPTEAVQSIVDDINKSDLVGVLDDLAPGERSAIATPLLNDIKELKRIKILQDSADPKNVAAVQSSIKDLAFDKTVVINDHVQITQLTAGKVSISTDASKIPFTSDFLNALFPNGGRPTGTNSTTIDIADAVKARGKPIRIATEKVDGHWYPSLFYTIADNAATDSGAGAPTAADYVAPKGAPSPQDAVKQTVNAVLQGDLTRVIELLSPDELAAVHDYAGLIAKSIGVGPSAPVHVDDLQLTTESAPDGAQRVLFKSVTVTNAQGEQIKVAVEGDCVRMTLPGKPEQRMCAAQIISQIDNMLAAFGGKPLTGAQRQALTHLVGGTTGGGILTTKSGGTWYVNPVQTLLDLSGSLLSRLQGNDVIELVGLVRNLSR